MKTFSLGYAFFLRLIGWILILLGSIFCFYFLAQIQKPWTTETAEYIPNATKIGLSIGNILLLLLSYFLLLRSGRKLIQYSKQKEIKEEVIDKIPEGDFVVYLRSFKEDNTFDIGTEESFKANLFGRLFFGLRNTEEQLITVLNKVGTVVCIGDPREKLPLLGAKRMYFREPGNRWQTEIVNMMQKSKLIVMRGGTTASLGWELEQVIKYDFRHKFICLLIEREGADYSVFEKLMEEKIQQPSSIYQYNAPRTWFQKHFKANNNFGKVFHFEENWLPKATNIVKFSPFKYFLRTRVNRPAELPLSQALAPSFKWMGLKPPMPSFWWFWILTMALLISLLVYSAYVFI
jgi:hypothetical protein